MPRGKTGSGLIFDGRVCAQCGGTRFYSVLSPEGMNGIRYVCRDCSNRRAREARQKDPEKYRARCRTWHTKHTEQKKIERRLVKYHVVAELGGNCACCGEDDLRFLTIDHINQDGKQHRREVGGSGHHVYLDIKRLGCPKDRFRVLCWNCHMATSRGDICPHKEGAVSVNG